ncbi:MAG: hypothetical protein RLZZ543_5 [Bacteroidota bacterium]|jgi:hypothetical protein
MRKLVVIALGIITLALGSCSNDLEINAPWKDITVVFGLLNKDQTTHYIHISKAFLGEGDAMEFASQFDSLYYDPTVLDVKVEEILNGNVTRTFTCIPTTDIPKDTGTFSSPSQILYKFETSATQKINPNATFRLTVKNTNTGNIVTAESPVVKNLILSSPSAIMTETNIYPQNATFIKWKTAENGKMYELFLRFKYREYSELDPSNVVSKQVELSLGRITTDNTLGGKEMSMNIENSTIYQTLNAYISPSTVDNPMIRIADSLQFQINVASDDLTTYLNVNQPSNTIAQERPQYTNITNGLGLFSSRVALIRTLYLNDFTVDSLRGNPLTEDINWQPR